jgi:acetyl esterase/lipase
MRSIDTLGDFMTRTRITLSLTLASALLASCGGGDGYTQFSLNGLAATGGPVAGKTVSIKCSGGDVATTSTSSAGAFNADLTAQSLPCMLEVESPTMGKLHGFATASGRVNLTPLTELILARAAGSSPATVFAAADASAFASISSRLASATSSVVDESARLTGSTPSGNPMTMTFAIGDDDDKALDNLAGSLANASTTLAKLSTAAAGSGTLLSALPAEEGRPHDLAPYTLNANDSVATTFAPMAAAAGDSVDMSTTLRFAGKLASYDNNPKSPYAAYRVEVPANWNGELVMYTHGYAGEGSTLGATDTSIRRHLIQAGYAWAASGYSKNSYDVRAGIEDTNKLALAFSSITGKAAPTRTYVIGHSMGGHIAAAAVEEEVYATAQNKVRYAGSVPMCGVLGDAELFDGMAAQGLAALTLSGYNAVLPAALTARQRYQMLLGVELNPNSVKVPVHAALFSGFPNAGFTPKGAAGAQYASVMRNLTGGARPLFDIGLSYGGSYYGGTYANFGVDGTLTGFLTKYSLDTSKMTYVVDGDNAASAALNASAPRVVADANSNPLRRDGLRWVPLTSGRPYAPVVTLHTLGDLFVPFSMEQIYRNRLNAAGAERASRVVQRAIRGATHCDFTNAEMEAAFDDMVKWVKQGTKPAGDDVTTPATVAAPTYGCAFTKDVFHPVDEAGGSTRTLRGLIQQLGQSCPAS